MSAETFTVTFIPSGGLRAIVDGLAERLEVELTGPTPLSRAAAQAGINPLLVMKFADGAGGLDRETVLDKPMTIYLVGPMAGG